ncbi:MAG: DUF1571 domain-containing protein [Fuerstiella sp.]|nr:DUF1571 domain-containing protein [Fuerstiella sp.]
MPRNSSRSRKPNLIAGTILAVTAGVLYTSFDPIPAGESLVPSPIHESLTVDNFTVPIPPEAVNLSVAVSDDRESPTTAVDINVTTEAEAETEAETEAGTLSNIELAEYSMLLLKDGAEYLQQFDTYSAVFHKQERLGGDLSEVQTIDLKIRQKKPFAVYMKWRNGDRGRQLLYSDEYEDGDMVVKLGGFKGRILPGLKLNPEGSRAKENARHSVTKAGIRMMAEKMIAHRKRDLAQGTGMKCTRLPNREFDHQDCFCFLYEYESPEISKDYRKSIILIESTHHIPVMARNYTWAAEANDLSPEELDVRTLIENYSYTNIDFSKTLASVEFSRENPRYRM